MPRFFSPSPLSLSDKVQDPAPLYAYDCSESLWRQIEGTIESAIESNQASVELEKAVSQARLGLALQPMLPLGKGSCIFEVLCRLDGGSIGGLLAKNPSESALHALDRWVIEQVCAHAQSGIQYAINLSGATIAHFAIVEWLEYQMKRYKTDPELLWLEITEQAVAAAGKAEETVKALARLGCKIGLDDYTSGNSNAIALQRFCGQISFLKLDGSIVKAIAEPCALEIIAGTLYTADRLGLYVVAEHVESAMQRQLLENLWQERFPDLPLFVQGWAVGAVEKWR